MAVQFINGLPIIQGEDGSQKISMVPSPFSDSDRFRARFLGFSGTATAGQVTDIQIKITEERWINGVNVILYGHSQNDSIKFQVVDVDNVVGYGAGVVLDEFGADWNVDAGSASQGQVIVPYPAKILANLYVRIKYTSTGESNVSVKANMFLHKKT